MADAVVVDAVVVGAGETAVATANAVLEADGDALVVIVGRDAGVRADPRLVVVDGEATGIERLPSGGFLLEVLTAGGTLCVSSGMVAIASPWCDHWRSWLAELGAVPGTRASSGHRKPGPAEVDVHGESSVDGLFVVADDQAHAAGNRIARARGRRVRQSAQDRMIYDQIWSVHRERRPDPMVVTAVRRMSEEDGRRRFVDLGCGVGRNALFAAAQGMDAIAVDHSARAVEQLRATAGKSGLRVQAHEMDFVTWLDDDQPLADIVACVAAVHHVDPDPVVVHGVLERIAALVAPGGYAHIALLTDIRYGDLPAPPGRMMISRAEGDALLASALRDLEPIESATVFVRHDDVVLMDVAKGEFARSFYESTRTDVLLHRSM